MTRTLSLLLALAALTCHASAGEPDKPLDISQLRARVSTGQWTNYPSNPVLKPGGKGEWDAGALGSMTVLKVGEIFHMYYEAWGTRSHNGDSADYLTLQWQTDQSPGFFRTPW